MNQIPTPPPPRIRHLPQIYWQRLKKLPKLRVLCVSLGESAKKVGLGLLIMLGSAPAVSLLVFSYLWCGRWLTHWYWGGPNLGHQSPLGIALWMAGSICLCIGSIMNCWPGSAELKSNRRVTAAVLLALAVTLFSAGAFLTLTAITAAQPPTTR